MELKNRVILQKIPIKSSHYIALLSSMQKKKKRYKLSGTNTAGVRFIKGDVHKISEKGLKSIESPFPKSFSDRTEKGKL